MNARDDISAHFTSDTLADQLLDAHRAEVLAEDGQAYDGELALLRSLVRTLRATVRPDDATVDQVRQLLHHHLNDDAAARAEKSAPDNGNATPALRDTHIADVLRAAALEIGEKVKSGGPRARGLAFARRMLLARADGVVPEPPRRNVNHMATAARLRTSPGEWLPVGDYGNPQSAASLTTQLRSGTGRVTAYQPTTDWEFRTERTSDGVRIWGRFVGAQSEGGEGRG
jgi:hypothetical protein